MMALLRLEPSGGFSLHSPHSSVFRQVRSLSETSVQAFVDLQENWFRR